MTEITIKIPEDIKALIADTDETIFVEALKEVARKRMAHTQKRIRDFRKKIAVYESKYGKSYEEFLQIIPDSPKGHEDWIEWSYLVKISSELANKMEKLRLLMGK